MNFNSAYLKLTIFYAGIVMLISLAFSFAIYGIASREIEQGLTRQNGVARDFPGNRIIMELEQLRIEQLRESNAHLQVNLVYFNLIILFISSLSSYFLAKRTLRPIEESVEAQNRFTADASHELRTPLTAMKSEIEVALRDKKMSISDARQLLVSNLEEIDKLTSLSSALLKLARNDQTARGGFAQIKIEKAISEAISKTKDLAGKKNIKVNYDFEQNALILGDYASIVELFIILLENAIKYSSADSAVNIASKSSNGKIIISFSDTGIGIKASDLPYIFNRFYRADHSRNKEKVPGYGLGLSIAKQIASLHGATLSVESKSGQGSNFIAKFKSI